MSEPRARHGRLPWLAPGELTAAQGEVYGAITEGPRSTGSTVPLVDAAGRLEGPFNSLLLDPPLGAAVAALGEAVRYRSSLSARARETAILELASLRGCQFEWYAHEHQALRAGLTAEQVSSLRRGDPAPGLDPAEQLVRSIVTSLVRERDLDDALFTEAEEVLGLPALSDLVVLVGYYDLLALGMVAFRSPLPEGAAPAADLGASARARSAASGEAESPVPPGRE
ncbi:MAG: carboxymuconolactone decarboxylase family protein [Acidimicrobiales bacterium]